LFKISIIRVAISYKPKNSSLFLPWLLLSTWQERRQQSPIQWLDTLTFKSSQSVLRSFFRKRSSHLRKYWPLVSGRRTFDNRFQDRLGIGTMMSILGSSMNDCIATDSRAFADPVMSMITWWRMLADSDPWVILVLHSIRLPADQAFQIGFNCSNWALPPLVTHCYSPPLGHRLPCKCLEWALSALVSYRPI